MASGLIASGIIGGTLAAGGTAAAIRAARMKANPRKVFYGGSADAYNNLTENYADQTDAAAGRVDEGVSGLSSAGQAGTNLSGIGRSLILNGQGAPMSTAGAQPLAQLDPAAVAASQSQIAADQNARANLAAGRSGGALALRSALAANAAAGVQSAQQAAQAGVEGAQNKAVLQSQNAVQNAEITNARRMGLINTGASLATAGNGQAIQAANAVTGAGLNQQELAQGALQATQDRQFQADMDFEQRRQSERQRRSDRIFQLGGSLITGGAAIAANGASKGGK
jgi:hypothetical protein